MFRAWPAMTAALKENKLEALWTEGLAEGRPVRFGQVAVKDAKFRTFIADAAARREIGKHVYDVTYGLVRPGMDTLVVLDDSIVRGTTMRDAILPMLDRLGPRRIGFSGICNAAGAMG